MNSSLATVLIYLVILFILSVFLMRKALVSFKDYSYCGRSLSIGFVFFTYLGTWIGGGTIIGLVGRSHDFGASQYWIMGMSCIVELFFAFFFCWTGSGTASAAVSRIFSQRLIRRGTGSSGSRRRQLCSFAM